MEIDVAGQLLPAIAGVGVALFAFAAILWIIKYRKPRMFLAPGESSRRRIVVVETAALDVRRRLILVRRDNVEHLIMVGGPADLVIETRELGTAAQARGRQQPSPDVAPQMQEPAQAHAYQPSRQHQDEYRQDATARQSSAATARPRRQSPAPAYEDDGYAYGPEAAALGRQYEVDEFQSFDDGDADYPQQHAAHEGASEDRAARMKRETAESILEAARQRLMTGQNGQGQTPRAPSQPTRTPPPPPRQSRAPTTAANMRDSAFSRVLDGTPKPGDIPASQTPRVQPERAWAPSLSGGQRAAARQPDPVQDEDALEEKVRVILDELQRRTR